MLSSIKKSTNRIKSSAIKSANATKRWLRQHRRKLIIIFVVLAAIGLTIGLVLGAWKGVQITNYGVIINYTEEKIINGTYNNYVGFIGLNSRYFMIPKRKFLIYFQDTPPIKDACWAKKINARSQQGTKLVVSARVSTKIIWGSQLMKDFLQQYGLDWQNYVIQKTKNTIIQKIASTPFYQLNNSLLLTQINSQFSSYLSLPSNPFSYKLLNIKLEYPTNSFSTVNNIGIKLLQQKSMYTQLIANYQQLNTKLISNVGEINDISARIGAMEAQVRMIQMQASAVDGNWNVGVEGLRRLFGADVVGMRRFLWLYFQKTYNGTYNQFSYY